MDPLIAATAFLVIVPVELPDKTFIATLVFIPYEVYELVTGVSPFKLVAFLLNVAVALYLLLAKRLFGLRGGGRVDELEGAYDNGWEALERTAPG